MAGAGNNVIINADDFNNAVDVINEISTTLFETKKELEDINSGICVNKEELTSKLDMLDNYFVKLSNIHKQVIGDKSIDNQFQDLLGKILKSFEDAKSNIDSKVEDTMVTLESLKKEHEDTINNERTALVGIFEKVKGKTNADGLSIIVTQLEKAITNANSALTNATLVNKELIAVRKSGIYPLAGGVLLGISFWTLAHFLFKGTLF